MGANLGGNSEGIAALLPQKITCFNRKLTRRLARFT